MLLLYIYVCNLLCVRACVQLCCCVSHLSLSHVQIIAFVFVCLCSCVCVCALVYVYLNVFMCMGSVYLSVRFFCVLLFGSFLRVYLSERVSSCLRFPIFLSPCVFCVCVFVGVGLRVCVCVCMCV